MNGMRQMLEDPQFRLDWAKRIVRLSERGTKVNPDELRRVHAILRHSKEVA